MARDVEPVAAKQTMKMRNKSRMSARDLKPLPAREEPKWLMNVQAEDDFPVHLALKNSLYYPASGLDGDPIRYIGGYIHSFVYVDYAVREAKISASLLDPRHRLKGYRLLFSKNVSEIDFSQNSGLVTHRQTGKQLVVGRAPERPFDYALWTVLERLDEFGDAHGPRRLSFFFVGGEAVEVFRLLYMDNGQMPDVVAIIHCGVGWGGVCTDLAHRDGPLAHHVLDLCKSHPQFVLYGVRANECSECCWPEFSRGVACWREHDGALGLWSKPSGDIQAEFDHSRAEPAQGDFWTDTRTAPAS
jgi:hypothetical protein